MPKSERIFDGSYHFAAISAWKRDSTTAPNNEFPMVSAFELEAKNVLRFSRLFEIVKLTVENQAGLLYELHFSDFSRFPNVANASDCLSTDVALMVAACASALWPTEETNWQPSFQLQILPTSDPQELKKQVLELITPEHPSLVILSQEHLKKLFKFYLDRYATTRFGRVQEAIRRTFLAISYNADSFLVFMREAWHRPLAPIQEASTATNLVLKIREKFQPQNDLADPSSNLTLNYNLPMRPNSPDWQRSVFFLGLCTSVAEELYHIAYPPVHVVPHPVGDDVPPEQFARYLVSEGEASAKNYAHHFSIWFTKTFFPQDILLQYLANQYQKNFKMALRNAEKILA